MSNQAYTLEELNYFRVCYIATNIIRDGLQCVFKQEWDRIHGVRLGPWQDTARNGQDFFIMASWRSRRRNNRLLRIIQNGNTSEWDSTCFSFAILYSDSLGGLVSPAVATNVDDLRTFRNKVFAHRSRASIVDADFQVDVNLVLNAFMALHLDTKELHKIISQSSFPTTELQQLQDKIGLLEEELQAEPRSFLCLPPKPSHAVTERKSEVEEILQMFKDLQENDADGSLATVYAHGNPGCGKSQIARSVGKRFYDEALTDGVHDSCTFVMTLNAESEQTIIDSYFKFARTLGVTEYSLNSIAGSDSKLKPDERISRLKTLVSAKVKDYATWLVIFDNANDLNSLKGCWPDEDWGGSGKVLVTTQDSTNLPFFDFSCQDISLSDGMQIEDALALLRSICQFSCASEDDELEQSVVEALDLQPLAIACAAIYVQFVHVSKVGGRAGAGTSTWKDYLSKLDMGKRQVTEQIYERTSKSYPLSMTSAVTIAVEKLLQNEHFRHMVYFMGLGAPASIDLDIITSLVTKCEPTLDADMVAAEIAKCSLVICHGQDDNRRTLIKVHQVVHDVFRTHLLDKCSKGEIAKINKMYIKTLVPLAQHNLLEFDLEFHMFSKMIAPHLNLLSNHLGSSSFWASPEAESDEVKKAFIDFGDICNQHGHLLAAVTYFEHALEITKEGDSDYGNRTTLIATILNNLGTVYCKQGQFQKAIDHHNRALSLIEGLNPGHPTPEAADSLNKLANVLYSLGRFQEAKENYRRSLRMREELYGTDHATVAASLNNLGCVHSAVGEHDIALDYYQRSLVLEETIHGKSHPHVADCLCNIGIEYSELGSKAKAVEYHEQALKLREELYFPDHLLISESYNNLGLMHKSMGQLERALHCYEAALRIRRKVLHDEHPAIAELLNNLGRLYMEMGDLEKSKDLLFEARSIREESLGTDHCKVGDTMLNLGLVFEQSFQLDCASIHFRSALENYSKSYPASHQLCQSANECLQRVTQQQADLQLRGPDQDNTRAIPLHLQTGFRAAARRSRILSALTGSAWERGVLTSASQFDFDEIIIRYLYILVGLYVKYYEGEAEKGFLKTVWFALPYFLIIDLSLVNIGLIVRDRAWLLNYVRNIHWRILCFFLWFVGYFLEPYF